MSDRAFATAMLIGIVGLSSTSRLVAAITGITGGNQPITNMQPSLAMNYIIRTQAADVRDLGEVMLFAGDFAPRGWAFPNGQILPIAQNQALFGRLGTTYGGNGQTTFALPDLRGRTAIHRGTGPGLTNRVLGEKVGNEAVTLSEAQMRAHSHALQPFTDMTVVAGGNEAFSNIQPSLALNYTIATQGIFPSRALDPFIAEVRLFAGSALPPGHVPADGQIMSIAQNTALFSLVGTMYGGNGQTNFALPDLRGRAVIHEGTGPGLKSRLLGERVGVEQVTLTEAQVPPHNHTLPPSSHTTDETGGGQPAENMQPSLALNYLIVTEGIFPARVAGEPLMGQLSLFAGNFAPRGWAFADGQLLSIATNTALFSLLGTTYGGDGQTTFALPDLRGRVAVHTGTGLGLTNRNLGEQFGLEQITISTSQLPAHVHEYLGVPPNTSQLFENIRGNTLTLIGENSIAIVSANGGDIGTSVLDSISMGANSKLDLSDNDLIIRSTAIAKDAEHAAVQSHIISAQNGLDANFITKWDGPGITSSAVRTSNVGSGFDLVGLGVIRNSDLDIITGLPGSSYTNFSGQPVSPDDVLVKYTYVGDANLDGVVSFDDYVGMDNAFFGLIPNLGWATGDINFDGLINFDDYTVVDQAFFFQGAPLRSEGDVAAISEPATWLSAALAVSLVAVWLHGFGKRGVANL